MRKIRCSFGKVVEKRLIDIEKDKKWLVDKVREKTGKYFDSSYLQKILTGELKNKSIKNSIEDILDLSNQTYKERQFIVTNMSDEVIAVISDSRIIEKSGYKVTVEELS